MFGIGSLAFAQIPIDPSLHPPAAPTFDNGAPLAGQAARDSGDPDYMFNIVVSRIINVIFSIAGFLAIYSIMNNAWFMVISAGAEEQITQHKKGLMWAIVGLIAIILAYSIISFIVMFPFKSGQTPDASIGTPAGTAGASSSSAPAEIAPPATPGYRAPSTTRGS